MKDDINDTYLAWLNDGEVRKYLLNAILPTSMEKLVDFYEGIVKSKNDVMMAICTKQEGKHIGNIKLGDINWVHRFADLGIMIGDKTQWNKGYGQEACRMMVKYGFMDINLNKIFLSVYGNHVAGIKAYTNVGFEVEGVMKAFYYWDGGYVDKFMMGIDKGKYKRGYEYA